MNIYRVNLNLLKVFSALMRDKNVSEAAKNLHLTQPAISNSLQQLRELFQDELLIRAGQKMLPTQKALMLAPKVEEALGQLESLCFQSESFCYQTSNRQFYLGMSDFSEYILLPQIYARLKNLAPHISLNVKIYNTFSPEDFTNERLELGIGVDRKFPKQLMSERLFADEPVCVGRSDHPLFQQQPFTIAHYLQAEHIAACAHSDELTRADQALKKLNLERNIKLSLPNVLPALQLVASSNLIVTLSKKLAQASQDKYSLDIVKPPFVIPSFYIAQIWHRQQKNDAGLVWLRNLIKEAAEELI